jgi:WRKY transcription factor 2
MIQGQASPTTGKLFMLGDSNNNNLARLEAPTIEDGPGTFCFKSLDLRSSQYAAEGKKVSSHVRFFIFSHYLV